MSNEKIFIRLSATTSVVNASSHAKYVSLCIQKYTTQPTIISLYPNEYSQGLRYYPFAVM